MVLEKLQIKLFSNCLMLPSAQWPPGFAEVSIDLTSGTNTKKAASFFYDADAYSGVVVVVVVAAGVEHPRVMAMVLLMQPRD